MVCTGFGACRLWFCDRLLFHDLFALQVYHHHLSLGASQNMPTRMATLPKAFPSGLPSHLGHHDRLQWSVARKHGLDLHHDLIAPR